MVFPQKLNVEMQALSGKNKAKSPIKIYVTNRINIFISQQIQFLIKTRILFLDIGH